MFSLSKRINHIAKQLKQKVPLHLLSVSAVSAWASISTTGTSYVITSSIAQGDTASDRTGNSVIVRRLSLRASVAPTTTTTQPCQMRISIVKAATGATLVGNMTTSYNPLLANGLFYVYYDKFFTVPTIIGPVATLEPANFPLNININLKMKHRQKFLSNAAGTEQGEAVMIVIQSNLASGATAPVIAGLLEVFFDPL